MITIIPAIDLIDGKCVRLTQGDYSRKKIYNENPLEVAKMFEDAGIKRLHVVDLDGAKAGNVVNKKVLYDIGAHTKLFVDYGGGIKSDDDLKVVFDNGASMATIGSIAVSNRSLLLKWFKQYGANRFIIGADVKNKHIAISGWLETTDTELHSFINGYLNEGADQFLCTDIARDGMLQGPSIDLYKEIIEMHPKAKLIASGGVSCTDDIVKCQKIGAHSVIIGKAFYEGIITLNDLKKFI